MTLLAWEGAQGISQAQMGLVFDSASGTLVRTTTVIPAPPEGVAWTSASSGLALANSKNVPAHTTGVVGNRVLHTPTGATVRQLVLFRLVDPAGVVHLSIENTIAGRLQVKDGTGAVLALSTFFVDNNAWYYLQVGYTIAAGGAGSVTLTWTVSGIETTETYPAITTRGAGGTATVGAILWFLSGSGSTNGENPCCASFYCLDTAGPAPWNSRLGAVRALMMLPNAVGFINTMTPLAGVNVDNVKEAVHDGDTSYVESSTLGAEDSYNLQNPTTTATVIYAVRGEAIVKAIGGARNVKIGIRTAGASYHSPDIAADLTYSRKSFEWLINPDSVVAWTQADLIALESGLQVST